MIADIINFIETLTKHSFSLIDVRSSSEFKQGHIPGAINIPLLDDEHRKIVGTIFKKQGRQSAVEKGFELAGPLFHLIIQQAKKNCTGNEVMMYCWRGGMRSNITAWILTIAGYKVTLLKGGYKEYRNWALQQFPLQRTIVVLGGKTGSGKTVLLQLIKEKGEQVICLETLAHHKGSAYGSLGQLSQYSNEHFENLLAYQLWQTNPQQTLWLENESRTIGYNKIPDALFDKMRVAPVIEIEVDYALRKQRILNEYGGFNKEVLAKKTLRLAKRLGGLKLKEALNFLSDNDKNGWVEIALGYYDRTYDHSNLQRDKKSIYPAKVNWKQPSETAQELIDQSKKIKF